MDYSQVNPLNRKAVKKGNRTYPELVKKSPLSEQEAAYYASLSLVAQIDDDLTRGIRHYRTKAGLLLNTLDEVVRAILDENLLLSDEQEDKMLWSTELAA